MGSKGLLLYDLCIRFNIRVCIRVCVLDGTRRYNFISQWQWSVLVFMEIIPKCTKVLHYVIIHFAN